MHKNIEPPRINARSRKHGMDFAPQPMLFETNYTEGHVRDLGGSVPEGTQTVYSKAIQSLYESNHILYDKKPPNSEEYTDLYIQYGTAWIIRYRYRVTFKIFNILWLLFLSLKHFVYIVCILSIIYRYLLSSSLNGNNGSYTNTDDVESQDDRKRRHKEAKTSRFKSGSNHKAKNQDKNPRLCNEINCTRKKCRFQHGSVGVEPVLVVKETPEVVPVIELVECYAFKEYRFRIVNNVASIFQPVSGIDCIVLDSHSLEVEIETFSAMGRRFPRHKFIVCGLFYQLMFDMLRIVTDEPRNYSVISIFVHERMKFLSAEDAFNHIVYFIYKNSTRTTPGHGQTVAHILRTVVATSALRVIPYFEAPHIVYTYNESFAILKSQGFTFSVDQNAGIVYPNFTTNSLVMPSNSGNRRAYFQFVSGAPFLVYGRTGVNVCGALSRYFKMQVNGLEKRRNQTKLLTDIPIEVVEQVATVCGAVYLVGNTVFTPEIVTGEVSLLREGNEDDFMDASPDVVVGTIKFRSVYKNSKQKRYIEYRPVYKDTGTTLHDVFVNNLSSRGILYFFSKFLDYVVGKFGDGWNSLVTIVYSRFYDIYDKTLGLQAYVQLPTPKRLLYAGYVYDPARLLKILNNQGEFVSKFKNEFGKYKKAGRLYASGEHLTLVDKVSADLVKYFFNQDLKIGELPSGGTFWAVYSDAQEAHKSDAIFTRARDLPVGDAMYIYFSDDGFLVVNRGCGLELAEVDISSCDATNGFPIFTALVDIAKLLEIEQPMITLLSQCARVTTIYNPCCKDEFVRLQPQSFFEYSGHNGTTVLNNVASVSIALGIYKEMLRCPESAIEALALNGALTYGYDVTVDRRPTLNSMTFLKRCSSTSGRTWVVLGTLLRSLGVISSSPTHEHFGITYAQYQESSVDVLTKRLLEQFIESSVNEPGHCVLNAFRARLGMEPLLETVTRQDLNERYGAEDYEWSELLSAIINLRFGDYICLPILDKIYNVDYGVTVIPPSDIPVVSEWY